jgi:hypothetical protein
MAFSGVLFNQSELTPFFQFLTAWGIRHYQRYLAPKDRKGDRVGVWVGYDIYSETNEGRVKISEEVRILVREQPLSILSGGSYPIDSQIVEVFAGMQSVDPVVQGVMLRILRR